MAGRRADEDPLYRTLAETMRERIRSGRYAVGAQIPTEHQLCVEEGVSRTTVRQAVQALVGEGVLDRQQGRGTFVTAAPAKPDVLFQTLPQAVFRFTLVESGWERPSFEMATAFGAPLDQEIFTMTRLRLDGDRPVAVTRYFSPVEALRSQPPTGPELSGVAFDCILRSRGVRAVRSNIMAELLAITGPDAEFLGVESGAISVATQRVGFNEHGRAVRLSRTTMRPDRARLFWSLNHRAGFDPDGAAALSVWAAPGTE